VTGMSEKIEASLNWPESGLRGVPDSDTGLTPIAPPKHKKTDPGSNGGSAPNSAGAVVHRDDSLDEGIATIARTADAVAASSDALRTVLDTKGDQLDDESVAVIQANLAAADAALAQLSETAGGVNDRLVEVNSALSQRLTFLEAELKFRTGQLAEDDPALFARTEFKGGLPGITFDGDDAVSRFFSGAAVNWPPYQPRSKPSLGRRLLYPILALVAVIAAAGVAYKVAEHHHATNPTNNGSVQKPITAYGTVKVVAGGSCVAGTTTATIQLAGAQAKDGDYYVSAQGTVSNKASTSLNSVVLTYTVTYQDGYKAVEHAQVADGASINSKSTRTWSSFLSNGEGTVPPSAAQVTSIAASTPQPGCS
jgi:hypothetical protein